MFRVASLGLCNLLFPWARCLVACRKNGWRMISPVWWQMDVFRLWQRSRDTRFYTGLLLTPSSAVTGFKRLCLLSRLRRFPEDEKSLNFNITDNSDLIIEFTGNRDYFTSLLQEHDTVRNELLTLTREEHKSGLAFNFRKSISVHARLGDFSPGNGSDLFTSQYNRRISLDWYVEAVGAIRCSVGQDWPVYIFSDGTDNELRPLLSMHGARRVTFGSALADLWALSQAHVLIASGSTFSMWAAYLGQIPSIWYPGQSRSLCVRTPATQVEWIPGASLPYIFRKSLVDSI